MRSWNKTSSDLIFFFSFHGICWNDDSVSGNPLLRYPGCGGSCASTVWQEELTVPALDPPSKTFTLLCPNMKNLVSYDMVGVNHPLCATYTQF